MPSILFSSFVISTVNYGPLSDIILSGNPYNIYILFLNSLANSSAKISSIMTTKYVIFDSLLYTIRIMFFFTTSVYSFSKTSFAISFSASASILFFILWHKLQPFTYFPTSLVTFGHQ